MEKSKGSGAYMELFLGRPSTGIDLYVPNIRLDEARNMLCSIPIEFDNMEESDSNSSRFAARRRWLKLGLLVLYIVPTLVGLTYFVFNTLRSAMSNIS